MVRIVFSKDLFSKAVEHCLTSAEKKNTTMPALANLLLQIEEGNCTLTATNLETAVIATVPVVESEQPVIMAIPAKNISEICRVTRGDKIAFDYDAEKKLLMIAAEKSNYALPCADYKEFPSVTIEQEGGVEITVGKLISGFKKLQFSMTESSVNRAYSGVLINKTANNTIEMVTTDIHRISVFTLKGFDIPLKELHEGIVIPGKNFNDIAKIFSPEEKVMFSVKEGKLTLSTPAVKLIIRLIKNEFPNYRTVVGTQEQIEAKDSAAVDRKELIAGVKRVIALNIEEKIWATRFEFKGNLLQMSATTEFGGNSNDEMVVEKGFKSDKSIGVNSRYLLEVLGVLDGEKVNVVVEEGLRPLTVVESTEESFYVHMVMPLRI